MNEFEAGVDALAEESETVWRCDLASLRPADRGPYLRALAGRLGALLAEHAGGDDPDPADTDLWEGE